MTNKWCLNLGYVVTTHRLCITGNVIAVLLFGLCGIHCLLIGLHCRDRSEVFNCRDVLCKSLFLFFFLLTLVTKVV